VSGKYQIIIKVEIHEGLQVEEVVEKLKEQLEAFCYVFGNKKIIISVNDPVKIEDFPRLPLALRFIPEDVRQEIDQFFIVKR
jgi:hypothetical protein